MLKFEDFTDGQPYTAIIEVLPVSGLINKSDSKVWLCQNSCSGDVANDSKGFKYSWVIITRKEDWVDGKERVYDLKLMQESRKSRFNGKIYKNNGEETFVYGG